MNRYEKSAKNRNKATLLNKSLGVNAAQARYRETGDWYSMLTRFPAALFDATGYILFSTKAALEATRGVQISKQISVRNGISSLIGYVLRSTAGKNTVFHYDEIYEPKKFWEGVLRRIIVNKFERSDNARSACIKHFGTSCHVCQVDFGMRYGQIGEGFIHVHHLRQLSEIRAGYSVDPEHDLVPVCPNCHAMLHQTSQPLTVSDLQERFRNSPENASPSAQVNRR